jgi:phage protein D
MRPAYRITLGGSDLTATIASRFAGLSISDEVGFTSDRLSLSLTDEGGTLELPRIGAELTAAIGWEGGTLYQSGAYVVDEIEIDGPDRMITVNARSADTRSGGAAVISSMKAARTRSWHDTTVGAIVQKIAAEHGFAASVDPTLAQIAIPHMDQTAESDANFLTRLGYDIGAAAKPTNGKLWFGDMGKGRPGPGAGRTVSISPAQVSNWSVTIGKRAKYGSIEAEWWDLVSGESKVERVAVGPGPAHRLKKQFATATEARAAAAAKAKDMKRAANRLSIAMVGEPSLLAECTLIVSGFRSGVDGTWVARKVVHDLSNAGYRTILEAHLPGDDPGTDSVAEPEDFEADDVAD